MSVPLDTFFLCPSNFSMLSAIPQNTVSLAFEVRDEIFVYGMFVQTSGPTRCRHNAMSARDSRRTILAHDQMLRFGSSAAALTL